MAEEKMKKTEQQKLSENRGERKREFLNEEAAERATPQNT